jgi:hypothetical protein
MISDRSSNVPLANGLWVRIVSAAEPVHAAAHIVRRLWPGPLVEQEPLAFIRVEPRRSIPIATRDEPIPETHMEWQTGSTAYTSTNGASGTLEWHGPSEPLCGSFAIAEGHERTMVAAVLRFLTTLLVIPHGRLMVHASATVAAPTERPRDAESAVLFLGNSGAGKTTTARRLGMAGARRLADDKVLLNFGSRLKIEPFCLDTGGWLRGRPGTMYDAHKAFVVEKGANATRVSRRVTDPLNAWCLAVMAPPLPFWASEILMARCVELAERLPIDVLEVAPRGTLLEALL